MNFKFVITGTGRCGTVFFARFLTSIGIVCGHESFFDYRGYDFADIKLREKMPIHTSFVSQVELKDGHHCPVDYWFEAGSHPDKIVAESSYMAAPFLHKIDAKFIHVVRHPIKVINSFVNYLGYFQQRHPQSVSNVKDYESFIFYHCPDLYADMSVPERAALYYIRWNQMIEKQLVDRVSIRHRIEDPVDRVFEFIGVDKPDSYFNQPVNSFERAGNKLRWEDIPEGDIKRELIEIAERYDYPTVVI